MTNMFEGCHSLRYIRFNNSLGYFSDTIDAMNNINFDGFLKGRATTDPLLTIFAKQDHKKYVFNDIRVKNLFANGTTLTYETQEVSGKNISEMSDSELSLELGIAVAWSDASIRYYAFFANNSGYNLSFKTYGYHWV